MLVTSYYVSPMETSNTLFHPQFASYKDVSIACDHITIIKTYIRPSLELSRTATACVLCPKLWRVFPRFWPSRLSVTVMVKSDTGSWQLRSGSLCLVTLVTDNDGAGVTRDTWPLGPRRIRRRKKYEEIERWDKTLQQFSQKVSDANIFWSML